MDARLTFSVGYQLPDDGGERFPDIVSDYRDAVSEVYFAAGDAPSARTPSADASGYAPDEAEEILQEDLSSLRAQGVKLNLLCNANCYGGEYGEIVYDFGTEGNGTLLMIASSYSNPINALIASHFDRTVVVDPRYWEKWTGESFDPAVCVTRAGADTVLLLGDIRFFTADLAAEGGGD